MGGGKRKAKVKKLSLVEKIDRDIEDANDEYIESLMKREEENMDGAYRFNNWNYKKPSAYVTKTLTPEERKQSLYDAQTMKLGQTIYD